MASIAIEDKRYHVVADFGFLEHYNLYAKRVMVGKNLKFVVKEPGCNWRFWCEADVIKQKEASLPNEKL